jgi:ABC-type Fe3+/spermidine/putrescine transport system ATPase subunit
MTTSRLEQDRPSAATVHLSDVSRSFRLERAASVAAVREVDLVIRSGSLTSLVGESGSGKSTLLRLIAGLERPDTGRIRIGDRTVHDHAAGVDVPTHLRNVGMVFQSFAVWPHLNVGENVAYPLRAQRVPRAEIVARVSEALELVGLRGMERRGSQQLSGGQQQRVAIARALVQHPEVLLLDEPFSALDGPLRLRLGAELLNLQRVTGITMVYVTHERREALELSDQVVVMGEGRVLQEGGPTEVYDRPSQRVVGELLGAANIIPVLGLGPPGTRTVETVLGRLEVANPQDVALEAAVLIRPEALRLTTPVGGQVPAPHPADGASPRGTGSSFNSWLATVRDVHRRGPTVRTTVEHGGLRLVIRSFALVHHDVGSEAEVSVDPAMCWVVRDERRVDEPGR